MIVRKLYVGNLASATTAAGLKKAFEQVGQVKRATIVMDSVTGESRGFGFVEMEDRNDVDSAIAVLNGKDLDGHAMRVALSDNSIRTLPRANFGF
jgi:RNA recognition motif-containing protein